MLPAGIVDVIPERPSYQALKGRIHQELLNRLNLDRLTQMSRAEAEPEIRSVIQTCSTARTSASPLSLASAKALITDVLNELFGLGPLEALLQRPRRSRTSWSTAPSRSTSSARGASRRPTSCSATTST